MVSTPARKPDRGSSPARTPAEQHHTTIKASEVFRSELRLEASAYSVEARLCVQEVRASGLRAAPLYGPGGVCKEVYNAFRFRRHYVSADKGVPFLSSSDIIRLDEPDGRYLSRKLTKHLDKLLIQKWDVLVSRSGTVGNVCLAGEMLSGKALSEHVIRLRHTDERLAGFVTAFLRSKFGRPQLAKASYGSVISHIEPAHLEGVWMPEPTPLLLAQIGKPMVEATECRDEAVRLISVAKANIIKAIGLPPLGKLRKKTARKKWHAVRASRLADRLEASFHGELAKEIEKELSKSGVEKLPLGDPRVSKEIRAITKFRKRVYVQSGGIPFLSSKQLYQFDPIDVKRLAKGAHEKDLPEIALQPGMIAVNRSGTESVGDVQIVPSYMAGWTASEHATRILVADSMNAGYVYAWLASGYGHELLLRQFYGSLILEIDKTMLASVSVPLLPQDQRDAIGALVVKANALRDAAWSLEREAIAKLEGLISSHGISSVPLQERTFYRLANEWQAETRHLPSAEQVAAHPAYQEIVAMRDEAVPYILQELAKRPAHWFRALHEITGANPVPEASRGNVQAMAGAWIQWGHGQGYGK